MKKRQIIEKEHYTTNVVTHGANLVRTPDGVLHIDVLQEPSEWEMVGFEFVCPHNEVEIVDYTEDHFGVIGHYQTVHTAYACALCGHTMEGDPIADEKEYLAEIQLMEALGK